MSKQNGKKKSFSTKVLLVGIIFLLLSLVWLNLTAAVKMAPFDVATSGGEHWGVAAGTFWFWRMFAADPGWSGTGQMHWGNEDIWSLLIVTFCYVISILFVLGVVFAIIGKKVKKNLPALLGLVVAGWYLGYICAMIVVPLNRGWIWRSAYFEWMVVAVLAIISFLSFALVPVLNLLNAAADAVKKEEPQEEEKKEEEPVGLTEEEVREIVRDELGKQEKDEEPAEEEPEEGMTEDQVREIVREELSHYEVVTEEEPEEEKPAEDENLAKEEEVVEEEPAAEEPVEEEPAEEAEEEADEKEGDDEEGEEEDGEEAEAEGEAGPDDPFAKLRTKRRRASFETKLKKSEEDLRHKYYDLRDYIKSYGVNPRISIPGVTFSAHREKFVFLTINGKHIKACFALNPDDYANTPIPVDRNEAKKYEDLPLAFKVKSDLSFRRACKLVDDLMAAKGIAKPEEKK